MQPPFGNHDAVTALIEGSRCLGRIVMGSQCPLAGKSGEDAKRVNALGYTACQCHVAFAQSQHLGTLDQAGVSRSTGGTERVVRASDARCSV